MFASNQYLALCRELHDKGVTSEFEVGSRLARGFADLGYEEFLLLPGAKLLSLFTGKISELRQDQELHFFAVPNVDELVQELLRRSAKVESVEFISQREWDVCVVSPRGQFRSRAHQLPSALARVLLQVLEALVEGGRASVQA